MVDGVVAMDNAGDYMFMACIKFINSVSVKIIREARLGSPTSVVTRYPHTLWAALGNAYWLIKWSITHVVWVECTRMGNGMVELNLR